jgi:hypothetical protein
MSIRKHSVIDILKKLTDQMVSNGEADDRDSDALFHLGMDIMSWKNIKNKWKNRYDQISQYIHDIDDHLLLFLCYVKAENLETFKLSDDVWEFIAFSDGSEGCRVSMTCHDNKLKVIRCEIVGEEDFESYAISDDEIYKILN